MDAKVTVVERPRGFMLTKVKGTLDKSEIKPGVRISINNATNIVDLQKNGFHVQHGPLKTR